MTYTTETIKLGRKTCELVSADSLLEYAQGQHDYIANGGAMWNNSWLDIDDSFYGPDTHARLVERALGEGWPEGLDLVESTHITAKPIAHGAFKRRHDVAGFRPNAARAAAGMPDCMVTRGDAISRGKCINIVAQANVSWMATQEQLNNFGAAVMAVIDALENQHVQTIVTRVTLSKEIEGNGFLATCVNLKQAGDVLDRENMALGLMHGGLFRRFEFFEYCKDGRENMGEYMGQHVETTTKQLAKVANIQPDDMQDTIFFGNMTENLHRLKTPQSAVQFVLSQIKETSAAELIDIDDISIAA